MNAADGISLSLSEEDELSLLSSEEETTGAATGLGSGAFCAGFRAGFFGDEGVPTNGFTATGVIVRVRGTELLNKGRSSSLESDMMGDTKDLVLGIDTEASDAAGVSGAAVVAGVAGLGVSLATFFLFARFLGVSVIRAHSAIFETADTTG